MNNFDYQNPVRIVFGKGTIAKLAELIDPGRRVMMTYGGGSIRQNGVYEQVAAALRDHTVVEFGGIEPNPTYETCMEAVAIARAEQVDFLLSVGGGSVLDGTKFIAAAIHYPGDPWEILAKGAAVTEAVELADVITLPATGSEMNCFSVISRKSTQEKLAFGQPSVYPKFSILDPETTYSLPQNQLRNGLVDAFVHVMEQYATYDVGSRLQDRQAEAIVRTLIEIAPDVLGKRDYDSRADFMWTATNALNGWINCGVVQDWSTHGIGHELTAFFGLTHAETLAIVLPGVWKHQFEQKKGKLAQLARRVWHVTDGDETAQANAAIENTEAFFHSMEMPTRLSHYGITEADIDKVVNRFAERGGTLGEHQNIGAKEVGQILRLGL
jgi:NADP-dependent alcohol dehydrogenase